MNKYEKMYSEKLKTVDQCLDLIKDNDIVTAATNGNEPGYFMENLHKIAGRVKGVKYCYGLSQKIYPFFDKKYRGSIDAYSTFLMPGGRAAWREKNIDYIPSHLHSFAKRSDPTDVVVISVTPMDEHGYFRHSLECIYEEEWMSTAREVILEVNDQMPAVFGDNLIHISDVSAIYEYSHPLITIGNPEPDEREKKIGEYAATLINDGDTIQLGIGTIPNAVAQSLKDKKDLGVHTEMISSNIANLVEWGVVTGKKKTLHKGKIVGTFALGDEKLYKFMANNPAIQMMPAYYVNDPWVIAQNDNMISINTGMCVDFYGQVCSESIGPQPYSGTGGQNDTAEGAIHSKGGKAIIALKSTAKGDSISTITPVLSPGSVVSLSANNVDYIITEYGIAELKGKNLRQRAENLISIAHPKFRDELKQAAIELGRI